MWILHLSSLQHWPSIISVTDAQIGESRFVATDSDMLPLAWAQRSWSWTSRSGSISTDYSSEKLGSRAIIKAWLAEPTLPRPSFWPARGGDCWATSLTSPRSRAAVVLLLLGKTLLHLAPALRSNTCVPRSYLSDMQQKTNRSQEPKVVVSQRNRWLTADRSRHLRNIRQIGRQLRFVS